MPFVPSSFLFLVLMPGASSSFLLLLAMPFVTSSLGVRECKHDSCKPNGRDLVHPRHIEQAIDGAAKLS